jgi:phytoene synthase
LPTDALRRLVEAHRKDLYGDAPENLQDLEAVFGETESALFQLASLCLGSDGPQTAEAAGHAGIAYGLTFQICRIAPLRRMGRQIAPADLLEVHGIEQQAMFGSEPPDGFDPVLGHLIDLAWQHLELARKAARTIPADFRPAFLPLALVPALLKRADRDRQVLWHRPVVISDLGVLVRIGKAALFGI